MNDSRFARKLFAKIENTVSLCKELKHKVTYEVIALAESSRKVIHKGTGENEILGSLHIKDMPHVLAKKSLTVPE